jgi:hypothetical protein
MGFRLLRDEITSGPPPPAPGEDDPCDLPGSNCERRFDRVRKDMFRYALFAHALGLPQNQCTVDGPDPDDEPDGVDEACQNDPNSGFNVPVTNSGIADFPGGDMMVTLGAFDNADGDPVGSRLMQATTLLHEFGHTAELTHAGIQVLTTPPTPREKNCKSNYLSVMNYLFQLRGLPDADGKPQVDLSRAQDPNPFISEFQLPDGSPLGA